MPNQKSELLLAKTNQRDEKSLKLLVLSVWMWTGLIAVFAGSALVHAVSTCMAGMYIAGFANLLGALLSSGFAYANFRSGRAIAQRRDSHYSFFLAGVNCLIFPLGTLVGAATWQVLSRKSVRELYEHSDSAARLSDSEQTQPDVARSSANIKGKPKLVVTPQAQALSAKHIDEALSDADEAEERLWKQLEDEHSRKQKGSDASP